MKTFGCVLLGLAGLALIVFGIISIVHNNTAIGELGGYNLDMFSGDVRRNCFFSTICQGINILIGVAAVYCALRGKPDFFITFCTYTSCCFDCVCYYRCSSGHNQHTNGYYKTRNGYHPSGCILLRCNLHSLQGKIC